MVAGGFAITCLGLVSIVLASITDLLIAIYLNQPLLWIILVIKLPIGIALSMIVNKYRDKFVMIAIKEQVRKGMDKVAVDI
jgi:hypothetical protein